MSQILVLQPHQKKQQQEQLLIDSENGVIVKIYKYEVNPILVGAACAATKLKGEQKKPNKTSYYFYA